MESELSAVLDDWMMVQVGAPLSAVVLVGRVAGHERLRDGNFCSTSPVIAWADDLTFAITSSQGRRYWLQNRSHCTLAHLAALVNVLFVNWRLPPSTPVWIDIDPETLLDSESPVLNG